MEIHPSWYAQFTPERGGAIHEDYIHQIIDYEFGEDDQQILYRAGLIRSDNSNEFVLGLTGSPYFYRTSEFIELISKATASNYQDLAKFVESEYLT